MSEINVTPLVDVMLVLLVVFIVTAPLLSNAVNVVLPKTVATASPELKRAVGVTIDRSGRVYLDGREIAAGDIEARLRELRAGATEVNIQLQADDGVGYGQVARVMALIQRAGVGKLSVLTAAE